MAKATAPKKNVYTLILEEVQKTPPYEITNKVRKGEVVIGQASEVSLRALALRQLKQSSFSKLAEEFAVCKPAEREPFVSRLEEFASEIHNIEHFVESQIQADIGTWQRGSIDLRAGGVIVAEPVDEEDKARASAALKEAPAVFAIRRGNSVKIAILDLSSIFGAGGLSDLLDDLLMSGRTGGGRTMF